MKKNGNRDKSFNLAIAKSCGVRYALTLRRRKHRRKFYCEINSHQQLQITIYEH